MQIQQNLNWGLRPKAGIWKASYIQYNYWGKGEEAYCYYISKELSAIYLRNRGQYQSPENKGFVFHN